MSHDVSDTRRLICVTGGNLRNDHLYVGDHRDFFPKECYGESRARNGTGRQITLIVEGLPQPIHTDIAKDQNGMSPRSFFRKRSWVGQFFRCHAVREDDLIAIEKLGCFTYRVYPLKIDSVRKEPCLKRSWSRSEPGRPGDLPLFAARGVRSVSKQFTEGRSAKTIREHIRRNGTVYTPSDFARFVARKVVHYFMCDRRESAESLFAEDRKFRILDPACGDGELLEGVWRQLIRRLHGLSSLPDPREVLCGIDMDQHAVLNTCARLGRLAAEIGCRGSVQPKVLCTNALFPYNEPCSAQGWNRVAQEFDVGDGFDVIVANPPWGAEVNSYRESLSKSEFTLFQGQFDTSDLFVEKALAVTRLGGYLAFIVPDSLFAQERECLRRLLLHQSHMKFLGRFGEKIFDKINRACAVFVCKKTRPKWNALVDCVRLTPESRKRIRSGTSTFDKEDKILSHRVPQARFISNPGHAFDIDTSVREEGILEFLQRQGRSFADYLLSSRGVELSKHGGVCLCRHCNRWAPLPSREEVPCTHCGHIVIRSNVETKSIITRERQETAVPLVVGESIRRYSIEHSLWIATGYDGINYKHPSIYRSPKMLVRKTGVGISAAIDYTHAYTNQVVYILHHKLGTDSDAMPLEFFLAVLNSRAIYYFLAKKAGEIEWRSHPYITQKQIMSLPMPTPETLREKSSVIQELCDLLQPYSKQHVEPPPSVDAQVERGVAAIFGLTRKHYSMIYQTLENVEPLLAIRALRRVSLSDLFA